jgi:hypothetical protein
VEEVTNIGRFGRHKIRPCKSVYFPILTTPTKLGHTRIPPQKKGLKQVCRRCILNAIL